ncbi:MAG: hypothetical protein O2968_13310 [Acidobacteria bacterium]|nr:hypothetical protein [Acidobacteriota bacterium]
MMVPVIICIDIEPELRAVDPNDRVDWAGFEEAVETLERFRKPLSEATKAAVSFSWFFRMDLQVEHVYGSADWAATRYGREIRMLRQEGDAIGLHIHPWRWDEIAEEWIADYDDADWGEQCVRCGFVAFERAFGRPCTEVRFGDRWLNNRILAVAEQHGARYDLTAEPGKEPRTLPERHSGAVPDYSLTPRHPYRPSQSDFQVPDHESGRDLWMIPVSTGRIAWAHAAWAAKAAQRPRKWSFRLGRSAYDGWIDEADSDYVAGWAFDARAPDRTVEIEVLDNGHCVASVPATLHRPDLARAGIGNGRHGFRFPWGNRLRDGREHDVRVRVAGTRFELKGCAGRVTARENAAPLNDYKVLDLGDDPLLMCALVDVLLEQENCPCLVYVVRSHSFSLQETRMHVERNLRHLVTHPRVSELALMTPGKGLKAVAE